MESLSLTNVEKAAVMLMALGKDQASEVMKYLTEPEVKKLSRAFMSVQEVGRETQREVGYEFKKMLQAAERVVVDGREFAKDVITGAFGEAGGDSMLQYISGTKKEQIGTLINEIPPPILEAFIQSEHPQTIAFLISKTSPDKAGEILSMMNEELQTDVLMRLAHLDTIKGDVIDEVREVLRGHLRGVGQKEDDAAGGPEAVAGILNFVDRNSEERILAEFQEAYPELAEEIRSLMFTFEDVLKVDDRGIQALLKDVAREDLLLALKTASNELKDLLLRNMSQRAAEMLADDLESLGKTKMKDIEKAQQSIIEVVRKLEAEGKIVIAGSGDDEFV